MKIQGDILNDPEELLTRAKAQSKTKIPNKHGISKRAMGYSIDVSSLIDMLATITIVGAANKKDITLDTALPTTLDQKIKQLAKWHRNR